MSKTVRLTAVILFALALSCALASGSPAQSTSTTLPGFTQVGSVFRANGFENYRSTYVRCYTDAEWRRVARSPSIIGFYNGGYWIHARDATCRNAIKILKGEVSYTNAVALSTLLHETIHRQGLRSEGVTECLASWMTAHVVMAWTQSFTKAIRALGYSRRFAGRLKDEYRTTNDECVRIANGYGIGNLDEDEEAEPPSYTPPSPPPPPAEYLVGYDVGPYPTVSGSFPYGHTVVRIAYSTVGPYDVRVLMSGSNGRTDNTYRVQGVGQFDLPLPAGYPAIRSGGAVVVAASPDFYWSFNNPGQSKIELRVITR